MRSIAVYCGSSNGSETIFSKIAKELGFEINMLDANYLLQSQQSESGNRFPMHNSIFSKSLNYKENSFNDFPYYLRGYKAIDKEISLIQSRTKEERLLMANGYVAFKNKLLALEIDLASSQMETTSEAIKKDSPYDWVEYDLAFADSKSKKKSKLYFMLSLIFGGLLGIIYVIISKNFHMRKV